MRKIRKNTFETNSSSTHAIAMCKDEFNEDNYISDSSDYIRIDSEWFEDENSEDPNTYRLDSPVVEELDETEYGIYFGRTEFKELNNPIDKILFIYTMINRLLPKARAIAFKKNVIKSFNYIKENNLVKIYGDLNERLLNKLFRMMDDMIDGKYYKGMYYLDEIDKKELDTDQDTFWSLGNRKKKTEDLKVELSGDFKGLDGIKTEFRKMLTYESTMSLIWNDKSYISLGGDEYHGFFIKRVGFKYDYDCEEDFKNKVEQEAKNYKVIFCNWG